MRVGAIDVGTNSVHLLVADVRPDGTWDVVEKARAQVELGAGGMHANRLSDDAFERGRVAMREFATAAESLGVEAINCAATSAVREAENGADWCRAVRRETGIHVRVIPGSEEGRLIYLGARADLDFTTGKVLLMDLGGGSTEFILCDSEEPVFIKSLPLGHIRLTEDHPAEKLKSVVRAGLKPLTSKVKGRQFRTLVGTSGTLRTLGRMATLRRGDPTPAHSHGLVVRREELDELVQVLKATPADQLSEVPGLDPRRRRTITAGAVLVQQVMRAFDKEELITSERSLRDGLIADWILRNRPEIELSSSVPHPRQRSVRALMERYGVDLAHARAVQTRALQLFDTLAPVHRLGFAQRELLEAAALLHDVGHHIAGASHNKHGQYLIRHSRLHGYTTPEIESIALLVRYHRGGKPKTDHPEYGALSVDDRQTVRVLAGLLRVADALDRSHTQAVKAVDVHHGDGRVTIAIDAEGDVHLERWALERRKDLLASALQHDIVVQVGPDHAADTVPAANR
jgi:exopolyphosphatase/guanosine-5'-triphosphate,3'-diphosphate pyrophosphatase